MDFDFKRRAEAAARSKPREQSSDEVLAKAKAERAERQRERQQRRSAATIQRWWRGSTTRAAVRRRLRAQWLQEHGSAVAQTQQAQPAAQVSALLLPPVLQAYLPAAAAASGRALLLAGSPLPDALLVDTAPLRGCFALLLRSLAASEPQHSLLALAAATADQPQQARLLGQLQRLLLLCCAVLGTPSGAAASLDPLLQAAAGRIVSILCGSPATQWKCWPADDQSAEARQLQRLQQRLHAWLAPLPLLSAAAQRLVGWLEINQQAAAGEIARSQQPPEQQQQQQQQQQLAAVLNSLVLAQLQLWRQLGQEAGSRDSAGSSGSSSASSSRATAAAQHMLQVLATPGLLPLLSPATAAQLTAAQGFPALLEAAATWQPATSKAEGVAQPAAPIAGRQQGTAGAMLCLLGTLVQLAAGKKVGAQPAPAAGTAAAGEKRQLAYLPPSSLLQQPGVAPALVAAAVALLRPAVEAGSMAASAAGDALQQQLWPFAEGTFASQLLQLLPLPQFVQLYHSLLLLADSARPNGSRSSSSGSSSLAGQAATARLLSALAFGTQLLARLWRHLATSIGLPLEAPMQATRGWEVPTLRRGIAGLQPEPAAQLGLFCRVYCHHLAVVDDWEFWERQQPFSLGQQRAVAAALNTLVFRTQLPDSGSSSGSGSLSGTKPGGGRSASLGLDYRMLQQAAPLLHRALYERDARRQFCPPALWLEPYHHLIDGTSGANTAQQAQQVSGAAVVRALLASEEDGSSDGRPGGASAASPRGGATAIASAAGGAGGGAAAASRPAAVAAILTAAPQCVPFEERVAVFRALIDTDKERCGYNLAPVDGGARPLPMTIRRGYVLEDASAQLGRMGSAVKSRLAITFINQQGLQEAGIDMGGLMKEFLESVVSAGFDPNRGLFAATPDGQAYPNPVAERLDGGLAALETLGLVLGRALYEGVLLDCPLAPFFVSRLQGRWPLFDELQALDPEVYRSLVQLKRYEGPVEDLCLDFTVESDFLGSTVSEELVPGGSRLAVTQGNLLQYVYLVADWHLNKRLGTAAVAFSRGLSRVIPAAWLRLFSPREVNQLLGGGEAAALDIDDMQAHTVYSNGYSAGSTTVKHFWAVLRGMTQEEQRSLLKFVTSCSRAPLGGFKHLHPPLTIHKVDCGASLLAAVGGKDVDRLPTASTCSNTLKLPNFRRSSTLREKLLYAIKSGAGFELS